MKLRPCETTKNETKKTGGKKEEEHWEEKRKRGGKRKKKIGKLKRDLVYYIILITYFTSNAECIPIMSFK